MSDATTDSAAMLPPVQYWVCRCCSTHAGADHGSRLMPNEWVVCSTCGDKCSCYGCICEAAEPA